MRKTFSQKMFFLHLLFLIAFVSGSHYRGGSISYTIRPSSTTNNESDLVAVRITQRHSWRRSAHFCNDTRPMTDNTIGESFLLANGSTRFPSYYLPSIDARVQCTDYSEEFDYSSGENSTTILLPADDTLIYTYSGCCWIPLLPPDSESNWSLKLLVNTRRRADGSINNSPKTAMNPIVQVEIGKTHSIRIPMADSDGDRVRCRWGQTVSECGTICSPKGRLKSDPCELTYNASRLGYHAVALVIEDFDSNDTVLSAIPLQFLIHIVNKTEETTVCPELPEYVGDWSADSCIGVQSNVTFHGRIQIRIPCTNSSTTLLNILTVSPTGVEKGEIERDLIDPQLYTMPIEWTPTGDQSGIQQLCVTPVDSHYRTGVQVCLTFQVDILPPQMIDFIPKGLVNINQSVWTIVTDRDIAPSRRSSGVLIRFFKRSNDQLIYQVDAANDPTIIYEQRQITFFTTGLTWEEDEQYYILIDNGIATINESCGVESNSISNSQTWTFRTEEGTTTTEASTTRSTTTAPVVLPECPRWLSFKTVSNESTNENQSQIVFCFKVESEMADVTIVANTWVPCATWKTSGAADPLLELYTWPEGEFLAQNDDGNSLAFENCYAAVLSYRLHRGDYRVVIRHPKCAFGKFELRLSAEIEQNLK